MSCIESGLPTINHLHKDDEGQARALLLLNVAAMAKELNQGVKRGLTAADVEDIVDMLLDPAEGLRYALNMADLGLFVKRCRRGYYGETYESLTAAKVCGWLRKYHDERMEAAEGMQLRERAQRLRTKNVTSPVMGEVLHAMLDRERPRWDKSLKHNQPTLTDKEYNNAKALVNSGLSYEEALNRVLEVRKSAEKGAETGNLQG